MNRGHLSRMAEAEVAINQVFQDSAQESERTTGTTARYVSGGLGVLHVGGTPAGQLKLKQTWTGVVPWLSPQSVPWQDS